MNEPFYDFTVLDEAHRFDFLSIGRNVIICSAGGTPARTRLYRAALSQNLSDLQNDFDIYGALEEDDSPEIFCKNKNYKGFFICKKNVKFTWH